MLVSTWVRVVNLQNFVDSCRVRPNQLPSWVLYVLPDMLWVSAFTLIFSSIWGADKSRYYWMLIPIALALSSEMGQKLGFISGTYDSSDIIGYVLGWLLALVLDSLLRRHKY